MSDWTPEELERVGQATQLQIASRRRDAGLRLYVTFCGSGMLWSE